MKIYVVRRGDTLNSIARDTGVPAGFIARWNGLRDPYPLAVGQSLLILTPTRTVTVRAGDSLFAIAEREGISVNSLWRLNPNLSGGTRLFAGQVLITEIAERGEYPAYLTGYAYPFVDRTVLRGILPYAAYLAPFTYGIGAGGGLVQLEDAALIELARAYGASPLLHLSTLTEGGSFSSQRAADLFADPARQESLAQEAADTVQEKGYDGIDLDFQFVEPEFADDYAAFAALLREKMNALGKILITALAPKVSRDQPGVLYEGHDYAAIGANSDAVLLMTYEWGYTYGPAMAVAPLQSVRRVLDFAVTEIPAEKIFMGFPNYAYNWTLPYTAGESRAASLSNVEAPLLAARVGAEIRFDETSQTPYFFYTDEAGAVHEVWFEDPRSCLAKFALVPEYGFRGVGYWNFMRPFPASFCLLDAMFDLRRP